MPEVLAHCSEIRPINGFGASQLLTVVGAPYKPCATGQTGEMSPVNVRAKLFSKNDTRCGFKLLIPCLHAEPEPTCVLDETKSGCSWDDETSKINSTYYVNFNESVWNITEMNNLGKKENDDDKFRFWNCSNNYSSTATER